MGWTFGYGSKRDVVDDLINMAGDRLISMAHVRDGVWFHVRTSPDLAESFGESFIMLALIEKDGGDWGYKLISEDMGPVLQNCPRSMLLASKCNHPLAQAWRARALAR